MSHHFAPSFADATALTPPRPLRATLRAAFDELEWSIIRLARSDKLWSIRPTGRFRRFVNWLLNIGAVELANERLEALRKAAVLSWHYGFSIPGQDVTDFLSAGFTSDQYELMVLSIADARTTPPRNHA